MEFTIYTLGDAESFRAALTAISMIFNPSNTTGWVSTTSELGMGYMAALALLVGFTLMLFKGVMTLKFELGQLLVAVIIYCIMFVPKFDVNIEDYYTGTVLRVDDVPLGIALPGSIISNMNIEISSQIDTAFSTVSGSYMDAQSTGFMTPLKILNQLRHGAATMPQLDPLLASSIKWLMIDCVAGRSQFDERKIRSEPNPMGYILGTITAGGVGGLTVYFDETSPAGRNTTCPDAATEIQDDLEAFYGSTNIPASTRNPSGLSRFSRMISMRSKASNTASGGGFTTAEYEQAFAAVAGVSAEQAKQFAITSLTSGLIIKSRLCANSAFSEAELARCMPLIQASYQYEEDSAGAATMFQRTMLTSMSVMLFLFYCFAPIVALMVLMLGAQGLKVLGAYMLFGVWTQSWLPVATVINFFIQQKVTTEFAKVGLDPTRILTIADAPALYDSIAMNVSTAADLLAATPLLTLALLTGSFFAMTGVATRMSGKDYYDEKLNAPAAMQTAPVAMATSAFSTTMGAPMFTQGLSDGPSINAGQAWSQTAQAMQATSAGLSQTIHQGEKAVWNQAMAKTQTADDAWKLGHSLGATYDKDFRAAYARKYGESALEQQDMRAQQGSGVIMEESAQKRTDARVSASAGFGVGAGFETTAKSGAPSAASRSGRILEGEFQGVEPPISLPRSRSGLVGGREPPAGRVDPAAIPGQPPAPAKTRPAEGTSARGRAGLDARAGSEISRTISTSEIGVSQEARNQSTGAGQNQATATDATATGARGSAASLSLRDEASQVRGYVKGLQERYGKEFGADLMKNLDMVDSYLAQQQRMETAMTQMGTSGTFSSTELLNATHRNEGFRDAIDQQSFNARLTHGQGFLDAAERYYHAQENTKLRSAPREDRERMANLMALQEMDSRGFGATMLTLFGDPAFKPSGAELRAGVNADIDAAAQQAAVGRDRLEADADASLNPNVRPAAEAAAAAVAPGLAAAKAATATPVAEGDVRRQHAVNTANAQRDAAGFVADAKAHAVDPSYKAERQVIGTGTLVLAQALDHVPGGGTLKQQLLDAQDKLDKYGDARGTVEGRRRIGQVDEVKDRERLTGDLQGALTQAGAHLQRHDPQAYNKIASSVFEARTAANTIAKENRALNDLGQPVSGLKNLGPSKKDGAPEGT